MLTWYDLLGVEPAAPHLVTAPWAHYDETSGFGGWS